MQIRKITQGSAAAVDAATAVQTIVWKLNFLLRGKQDRIYAENSAQLREWCGGIYLLISQMLQRNSIYLNELIQYLIFTITLMSVMSCEKPKLLLSSLLL